MRPSTDTKLRSRYRERFGEPWRGDDAALQRLWDEADKKLWRSHVGSRVDATVKMMREEGARA
jgi:hypothetical protein